MFALDCPTHGTRVLVSDRRIRGVDAVPGGVVLRCTCWCGTEVDTTVLRLARHAAP